jgi:hypothetical protein
MPLAINNAGIAQPGGFLAPGSDAVERCSMCCRWCRGSMAGAGRLFGEQGADEVVADALTQQIRQGLT